MGVFDEIRCEYPLSEGYEEYQDDIFQTKDLENLLIRYTITKEGRLVHDRTYYEDHPTDTKWNAFLKRDIPVQVLAHQTRIDEDYHGDIRFYTGGAQWWLEFEARFTEGNLQGIRLVEARGLRASGKREG